MRVASSPTETPARFAALFTRPGWRIAFWIQFPTWNLFSPQPVRQSVHGFAEGDDLLFTVNAAACFTWHVQPHSISYFLFPQR
jgi:hypothetical protein